MRIMLVTESFTPATDPGADSARHIVDALLGTGHQVVVVTTTPGHNSYRGARVLRSRVLFSGPAIRRAAEDLDPDVVQVLTPRALGTVAMRALEGSGLATFVLDPTPLHPRSGTVLASSATAARVLAAAGVEARVWRAGVRPDEHHPGLRDQRLHDHWARAGRPGGDLTVVGYCGPVGLPTSKTVRRLSRIATLDGVRLVVLGSGPGTAALKEAGAKIVGATSGLELARAIASLDVLVQPRKQGSTLTSARKALASGVPVVAFAAGAASELIVHERTGLLVPTGTGGLGRAVARLVGDPALRAHLAGNARASVAGRTWADAVEELVALYPATVPLAAAG